MQWDDSGAVLLYSRGKKQKEKKKGVDLNFYIWQKYILKYFFRHTKAEKNFISDIASQPLQ